MSEDVMEGWEKKREHTGNFSMFHFKTLRAKWTDLEGQIEACESQQSNCTFHQLHTAKIDQLNTIPPNHTHLHCTIMNWTRTTEGNGKREKKSKYVASFFHTPMILVLSSQDKKIIRQVLSDSENHVTDTLGDK